MATYTFTNPSNGQIISIRGPATLTRDQAQFIFNQQLKTGALVGLKAGDVISPATQVAGGLTSAQSQLAQQTAQTKQTYNDIAIKIRICISIDKRRGGIFIPPLFYILLALSTLNIVT